MSQSDQQESNGNSMPSMRNFAHSLMLIGTLNSIWITNSLSCFETFKGSFEVVDQEEDSLGQRLKSETKIGSQVKKKKGGCKCKKTNCRKMYCQCFASGKACGEDCLCSDCTNHMQSGSTKYKNSTQIKEIKKCNCKKSQCKKNYCQCYYAGVECGSQCKCIGCQNNINELGKKQIIIVKKDMLMKSFNNIPQFDIKYHQQSE